MARRRKKATKRRRSRGKKKRGGPKVKGGLATDLGAAVSAFKVATDKTTTGASPYDAFKATNPIDVKAVDILTRAGKNVLNVDNSKYVIGGAAVTWGKNKPVVKVVLGPVNRMCRRCLLYTSPSPRDRS